MATFILKARYEISRKGFLIRKGQEISIQINMKDITPGNLFSCYRCRDALIKQLKLNGIEALQNDLVYSESPWEIRML